MRPRSVLWLVPCLLALHNAEEALFFPRSLPFVLSRLPAGWQSVVAPLTTGQVWSALALVTGSAFLEAWWADRSPDSASALWALAPGAILLHGPLLAALLVAAERWPR